MAEETGTGEGGEELTFSAEQLAVIDRIVAARLAAVSVPASPVLGGADPPSSSVPPILPSSATGKFLSSVLPERALAYARAEHRDARLGYPRPHAG